MIALIPESFGKTFEEGIKEGLPSHLTLHQALPNQEGAKASCLWEAAQVEEVKNFLESEVGEFSNNIYFAVEAEGAVGLSDVAHA